MKRLITLIMLIACIGLSRAYAGDDENDAANDGQHENSDHDQQDNGEESQTDDGDNED